MKRRTLLLTGAAAASAASLGLPARAQTPLKVGFVYVGPIGDGGWTFQHDQGRLAVESTSATRSRRSTRRTCPKAPMPNAC